MTATVIQEDLVVEGNLVAKEGAVSVSGTVRGDIDAKTIEILPPGSVQGGLSGEDVTVAGKLDGSIRCTALSLAERSVVKADVSAGTMTMSAGAQISGRIEARGG